MSETTNEDSGAGRSVEGNSNGQRSPSEAALAEWRSSDQVESGTPSRTSPPYWDIDDFGPKPSELIGRKCWKIEKFSERKLRSDVFGVCGYEWYILLYPQGCDVNNHLSLYLCVANPDKLRPDWNFLAQFTVALVNTADLKKSKHSEAIHRFCKKEHVCGWTNFIELPKLQEGYLHDSGSLLITSQVQVIRENVDRPFRCLDIQYRRELVRVYLKSVEQTCSRFVETERRRYNKLKEDKAKWASFSAFWLGLDQNTRRQMSRERRDVIHKLLVRVFFSEKEFTSTLVMDAFYSGLKALALQGHTKSRPRLTDTEELPAPMVSMHRNMFVLADDLLLLLERAALEPIPPKEEDIGFQTRTKDGNDRDAVDNEATERDERRLTELGRLTIERFVLVHLFITKILVAYQEAVAWSRQEDLIREEEEALLVESEHKAKRGAAEKEKKSKKKKKKNKGKAKKKEDTVRTQAEERSTEKDEFDPKNQCPSLEQAKPETKDVVPQREAVPSPSSSRDIQLQTVVSEADIPKTASPKPAAQPVQSMSRPVSAPKIPPKQAAPITPPKQAAPIIPPKEAAPITPPKQAAPIIPPKQATPIIPPKEAAPIIPPKQAALIIPPKEAVPIIPPKQAAPIIPPKQAALIIPPKEAVPIVPPKQAAPIIPPKQAAPIIPPKQATPIIPPKEAAPIISSKQAALIIPPKEAVPIIPPKQAAPIIPQKQAALIIPPKEAVPIIPPKKAAPIIPPKQAGPIIPLKEAAPIIPLKQAALIIPLKQATPIIPPKEAAPIIPPKQAALIISPKEAVPIIPLKQAAPIIPLKEAAPIIPPKQAAPIVSAVQTSTSSFASPVQAGRLGSPPHSQTYIPQSDKHAIVGSSGFNHSSSQPTVTSTLPPCSHPPPVSVSNQSAIPINFGSWDVSPINFGSWDVSPINFGSCGSGSNKDTTTTTTISGSHGTNPCNTPVTTNNGSSSNRDTSISGNHGTNPYNTPVTTSIQPTNNVQFGKTAHTVMTDEYPHLDIINDLLEDDYGSMESNVYRIPQRFNNNQYSYHGTADLGISGRSQSYSEYMPYFSSSSYFPYGSGQMDELAQTQWQMANMDMSLVAMRNQDDAAFASASNYSYFNLGSSSDPDLSSGVNGYRNFRPWNGN